MKVLVVVNKIDRPDARRDGGLDEVLARFGERGADDDQRELRGVYA